MELTLKLGTGYDEYGNESGMQIDTLARAVVDYTSTELETWEEEDRARDYVLEEYDYENSFLKTLTKDTAKYYMDNPLQYGAGLDRYIVDLKEKAIDGILSDEHALSIEMQEAVDEVQTTNYRHFLHGDGRYTAGVIREAERYLDIEVNYIEKDDTICVSVSDERVQELLDDNDIERKTKKAVKYYLEQAYENKASANWYKSQERKKERQEQYAKTKAYQEEIAKRKAEEKEAERIKKLQAII